VCKALLSLILLKLHVLGAGFSRPGSTFEQPGPSRALCLFCTEASNQQLIDLGTISSDSASMLHILRPLVVLIFCFSFNLVQADIYLYGARHEVVRLSTDLQDL
jgi:hypothetical protein